MPSIHFIILLGISNNVSGSSFEFGQYLQQLPVMAEKHFATLDNLFILLLNMHMPRSKHN